MFGQVRVKGPTKNHLMALADSAAYPVRQDGHNLYASFAPTGPTYTWSAFRNEFNGRFAFGLMSKNLLNRDPFISSYTTETNRLNFTRRIPLGVAPLDADTHRIPYVATDSNGHIYVACELLSATLGHGTSILLYRTTEVGNVNSLVLIKTLTGRWSYPVIIINSWDKIFITARGGTDTGTFIRGQQWYWNSTDGGANFSSPVKLYDSGDEDKVAYIWAQWDFNGEICLILNERDNVLQNWTFISMVRGTFNSNVWTNAGETASKNVSSSGAFNRTEMMTNNLVMQSSDFTDVAVNHEGGYVKSDGSIKMLVSVQNLTGNFYVGNPEADLTELRFYNFSGGSWSYQNVDIPGSTITFYWSYQRYWVYMPNDSSYDDICFIDPTNNRNVYLKRSTDNFATESQRLQLEGNGKYRFGTYAPNVTGIDDYFVVLLSTEGDLFQITAETTLDYTNIYLFRNFAM